MIYNKTHHSLKRFNSHKYSHNKSPNPTLWSRTNKARLLVGRCHLFVSLFHFSGVKQFIRGLGGKSWFHPPPSRVNKPPALQGTLITITGKAPSPFLGLFIYYVTLLLRYSISSLPYVTMLFDLVCGICLGWVFSDWWNKREGDMDLGKLTSCVQFWNSLRGMVGYLFVFVP